MPGGQGNHTIDDAVCVLRETRAAYEHLFKHPNPENLITCTEKHARAVELLNGKAVMQCIDERIAWARDNDHTTVKLALHNLEHPDEGVAEFEIAVGQLLGYRRPKMKRLIKDAKNNLKRALSKGVVPPAPEAMGTLIGALENLHELSVEWVESNRKIGSGQGNTQKVPHRIKRARKSGARKRATKDLLVVGSIVANGKHENYFQYSYAISLGLAADNS